MLFLDHAIVFVKDLERAAATWRTLGFALTPAGRHERLGTANHTIMLERTYLELLTVERPEPGNRTWAAILDRREGFGAMALGTRDARGTAASLRSRGLEIPEVVDFGRAVRTAEGTAEARFSVAHLPTEATPLLPGFFCQHHTPELVWLPEYQSHPNTAFHVAGLTVVHPDPESAAHGYDRLLGRAAAHPHPGGIALDLRGTRLWIVTPGFAEARLGAKVGEVPSTGLPVGLSILVHDLDTARSVLDDGRVPHRPFGRRSILIGPAATSGVHLELLAA